MEYTLTPAGQQLRPVIDALATWGSTLAGQATGP
ncbi:MULTISPECIES: winged helix-turn-helix transcriptional regulator [unclassified Micromonospora]